MAEKKKIVKEIEIPDGITTSITTNISGSTLAFKGAKGEVSRQFIIQNCQIKVNGKKIIVESSRDTKNDRKMVGSAVAHIRNMARGVAEGYKYVLKICSGHFPMNVAVSGNKLSVKNFLGEKVPRVLELKQGAKVTVEDDKIIVESSSKETAGQVSADIEQLTRRAGYDSRVFQDGCYIISKDGKELK